MSVLLLCSNSNLSESVNWLAFPRAEFTQLNGIFDNDDKTFRCIIILTKSINWKVFVVHFCTQIS